MISRSRAMQPWKICASRYLAVSLFASTCASLSLPRSHKSHQDRLSSNAVVPAPTESRFAALTVTAENGEEPVPDAPRFDLKPISP